jgi:hypothetical protein
VFYAMGSQVQSSRSKVARESAASVLTSFVPTSSSVSLALTPLTSALVRSLGLGGLIGIALIISLLITAGCGPPL